MHEIVAQVGGALERLVALAQRPLGRDLVGHVGEGDERRPIRQGRGGDVELAASRRATSGARGFAPVAEAGHDGTHRLPHLGVRRERLAQFDDRVDMRAAVARSAGDRFQLVWKARL